MAWRGLGGAGGAPRWRLSDPLSLAAAVAAAGVAEQADVRPCEVAAVDVAVGAGGGLRVLLQTCGAGGTQRLHVVDVQGDPTSTLPGVERRLESCCQTD